MKQKLPITTFILIVALITILMTHQFCNSTSRNSEESTINSGPMTLRLELFTSNIDNTVKFYQEVLDFKPLGSPSSNYHPIQNGHVVLGIGLLENLGNDHYFNPNQDDVQYGYGVEIVLEVDDIHYIYSKVKLTDIEIESELQEQPWGLTDFRLADPNGYYIRITSKD